MSAAAAPSGWPAASPATPSTSSGRWGAASPSTRRSQNLLLVAGGIGVAALVALADEAAAEGRSLTLLQGARTAARLFPTALLPPEVEVVTATDDGSAGHHGPVTDLLAQHLPWADQVFACGPTPMFRAMAAVVRQEASRKPVQALLEERMGCGTGVCYSCAVFTRRGVRLVCKDGRLVVRKTARCLSYGMCSEGVRHPEALTFSAS